jgi:hypothetical protein
VPGEGRELHAHGPLRLPEPDRVKSVWDALEGRDTHPAQPPLAQPPDLGHPAVPRPAQGHLHLGPIADGLDEDRVVEHLDIDAKGIQVPNPEVHIAHLAGFLLRAHIPAEFRGQRGQLLLGQGWKAQATDLAVDHPGIAACTPDRGVGGNGHGDGPILAVRWLEIVPGALTLQDVRIRVDHHGLRLSHCAFLPPQRRDQLRQPASCSLYEAKTPATSALAASAGSLLHSPQWSGP